MNAQEIIFGLGMAIFVMAGAYAVFRLGCMGLGWLYRQIFREETEVIDGDFELDYERENPDAKVMRERGEK